MSRLRSILLRYGVTAAVAGALSAYILWLRDMGSAATNVEIYWILADAFTVPGLLLLCVGSLVWVSTDGFFDSLTYAFSRVAGRLIPFLGKNDKHQTYYDYVQSKKGKRIKGYAFLFWVGLAFTAVGVVFVILHQSVYVPLA